MFDLEKALGAWRDHLQCRGVFLPEDIKELEGHLRELVARLTSSGMDEEEAFRRAVRRLGDDGILEAEYRKVRWTKAKRNRHLWRTLYWEAIMLKHYLKIAFRVFSKQKGYAVLNLAGLVLGLAPCILVLLYIQHELSFDRSHEKADQVYRVVNDSRKPRGGVAWESSSIRNSYLWAQMLQDEFPEVLEATRLHHRFDPVFQYGRKQFVERKHLFVDANVFDVFTMPLLRGNPETALVAPYSIVLTEALARKYFGDADPIGQTLSITSEDGLTPDASGEYTVTGIMEALPSNSHLQVDCLLSLSTIDTASGWFTRFEAAVHYGIVWNFFTYIVLPEDYAPEKLEAKFPATLRKYLPAAVEKFSKMPYDEFEKAGYYWTFRLQPLRDIYLEPFAINYVGGAAGDRMPIFRTGNARQVYFLGLIGLVLLLIACINFINLTTARSAIRAREVGVRKVVGAHRGQLVRQFLGEAILLALVATLLALTLAVLALPSFRAFMGAEVALSWRQNWSMGVGLLGLALAVGVLAGSYPAFFLSSFQPVAVLKGTLQPESGKASLRNSLVVVQFVISIGLIMATIVVTRQLAYMQEKELGFDKENVVVIEKANRLVNVEERDGQVSYDPQGSDPDYNRYATLKAELLRHPNVISVSGVWAGVRLDALFEAWEYTFRAEGAPEEETVEMGFGVAEADIVATLGLEQVAGGNLVQALSEQTPRGLVLNESAAKLLEKRSGWSDPTGQRLTIVGPWSGGGTRPVIGVVKDFHAKSLHSELGPQVLMIERGGSDWFYEFLVRIGPGDVAGTLAYLEQTWDALTGGLDMLAMEYSFLDEKIDRLYASEVRLQTIFGFFSALAIVIACLGVFGLAAFMAERRTKEIGIRKVLGATATSIVVLLSKDLVRLVAVAFVVASPLIYLAMRRWLEGFAYRIEFGVGVLVLVGVLTLLIALLTVSYQSIKASLANPVESLRYE